MSRLSWRIRSHQLAAFCILAFAISWCLWISQIVFTGGRMSFLTYAGAFGPFLSAVFVTWIVDGRPGLHTWFRTTFRLRINIWWYLLGALFLPIGVVCIQFGLYTLLGGQPDFSSALSWWLYPLNLLVLMFFAGGNEEPGWRGFALPRLVTRNNPLTASLILGAIWAAWHIPLFLNQEWGGYETPFVWFVVNTVGLSFIMTWLYYRSSRSVFPVMMFHQATNVIWHHFPMPDDVLSGIDDFIVLKTVAYWTIAVILIIATRGRLGYQSQLFHQVANKAGSAS